VSDTCSICGSGVQSSDNFCRTCGVQLGNQVESKSPRLSGVSPRVLVGIFTAVLGSLVTLLGYLFGIIPLLALGIAALILGIMVLYLPEPGRVPSSLATSVSLSAIINMERLLEELYLEEKGVYIPMTDADVAPKVFIPLTQTKVTEQPSLEIARRGRLFVRVGEAPGEMGVLLEAPGGQILLHLEKLLGVNLAKTGLDDVKNTLRTGFESLGVGGNLTFEQQDDTVNVSITLLALVDLETKIRSLAPRLVSQVGGPVESAIAAAVAKVTRCYVVLRQTGLEPAKGRVTVVLELRKLSTGVGGGAIIGEQ